MIQTKTDSGIAAAPLVLSLFGPMHVSVEGSPLPPLRSRKALWLLALLTLRHNRPVERAWVAGMLWPDIDQEKAFDNLRPVLSELRKALGSQGRRLEAPSRHVLSLNLMGAEVDVLSFDEQISSKNLPVLEQAVMLYRGLLLEGCTEEWVGQERDAREACCLRALQSLADAALAAKDYSTATTHYRRALGIAPLWEASLRGLMVSLDSSGDRNAALQVYREFNELLRRDHKAVPDTETSALYARLRAQVKQPFIAPPTEEVTTVPIISVYLPHALTELVGREDERTDVAILLRRTRLVTLTGTGGIGKTRLAIAIASDVSPEYADGVWLISLEALSEGAQVVGQIAGVLDLIEEKGESLLERLTRHLHRKRALLVLDNCEHLLEASARIADHLLRKCAGLRILATSREGFGILGETAWRVPSLATLDPAHLPTGMVVAQRVLGGYDSIRLFVERAQAVQSDFALTPENARTVAEVCFRLEGIPLAIELAAARVKSLTVEQIVARLDNHLRLLVEGNRTALSRQQTLRATLDWSYDLLSVAERLLLGRLSVFVGGWDLDAADQVGLGDGVEAQHILPLLTSLVDKSLILFGANVGQKGIGRYRLLETVRQYASERLQTSGEAREVALRHCDYFLSVVEESEPHLIGPQPDTGLRRLRSEYENIRAAMASCSSAMDGARTQLRFTGALWRFWHIRGDYTEGRRYLELALEHAEDYAETPERAKALNGAAGLAYRQNDYPAAQERFDESLSLRQKFGDIFGIGECLSGLAGVALSQGDYPKARTLCEQALSLQRECGHQQGIADTLNCLGTIAFSLADLATARSLFQQSLSLSRQIGSKRGIGWTLFRLCNMAICAEDFVAAEPMVEECLRLFAEIGERRGSMWARFHISAIRMSQNRHEDARALAEESLTSFREMGDRGGISLLLNRLGEIEISLGRYNRARTLLQESLPIARGMRNEEGVAEALWLLAIVTLAVSEYETGAWFTGAADALHEKIGAEVPPAPRELHTRWVVPARAVLGQESFDAAWAAGHAMTWEKAVAYALGEEQ